MSTAARFRHTRLSTWIIEMMLDTSLIPILFIILTVIISEYGQDLSFRLNFLITFFMAAIFFSIGAKSVLYYPHVTLFRLNTATGKNQFSLKKSISLTFASWLVGFFIFAMIMNLQISDRPFFANVLSFILNLPMSAFPLMPLLLPALIAPILTYRLTGYCFDSDFSLPPWSHGRWGFGKLAPTAESSVASTPAPIDRPDPDTSPPTGSKGVG